MLSTGYKSMEAPVVRLRAAVLVGRLPAPDWSAQRQRRRPEFFLETFDLCQRWRGGFRIFSGVAKLFNFR
jgi:hypothetical protein